MEISKGLEIVINQMVDELNANLPEDSEPQTADGWIVNTLKAALADYYGNKPMLDKEGELNLAKRAVQEKEWEIQKLRVAKREEILKV